MRPVATKFSRTLFVLLALVGTCTAQTVSTIYSFTQQDEFPSTALVQGRNGKLYGTTAGGVGTNYGSIFNLATTGTFSELYTFDSTNGSRPAGVMLASDGEFYGTTFSGGSAGLGVLFRISRGTYTVLHEFAGGADGAYPTAPPIEGFDGNLYGATYGSTTTSSTIYTYSRVSGTFATIYQFDNAHGSSVIASLTQSMDGNLLGTAWQGGANNCGTIFRVTTSGVPVWYYSFPCGQGGANPYGQIVQANGNFYGTTQQGGNGGFGTIFKLDQRGLVSILYRFGAVPDGEDPYAGLVQGTDGNLYGVTAVGGCCEFGSLFQITTTGIYRQIYSFATSAAGFSPIVALLQHTNGLFYGTTLEGGMSGLGTVYSLDMGLGPFVTLVRAQGKIGSTAQILGQGLTGTSALTFNGVPATSFSVLSDTCMTAIVPSGATTGPVAVTTPTGTLISNKTFRVVQ